MTYGTSLDTEGAAMRVAFTFAAALLFGFGAFAFMRWVPSMVESRMDLFDALLKQAGVEPNGWIRDRLQAQAARRHVWGAVGAGIGYALPFFPGGLLGPGVLDGARGLLGIVGFWFGFGVGASASALFPLRRPRGPILVTAMQPHGMTEYLHHREILVEVSLGVLGWVCAVAGALALLNIIDVAVIRHTAPSMLLVGGVVAVVATTTLFGQRRLVAAPLRADNEAGLLTADIILALGLRDLLAVTVSTAATAGCMAAWLPDRAWWLVAVFALAAVISMGVSLAVRKQPSSLPVTHRLAVRSRAA
jgi:hypothetical protein